MCWEQMMTQVEEEEEEEKKKEMEEFPVMISLHNYKLVHSNVMSEWEHTIN